MGGFGTGLGGVGKVGCRLDGVPGVYLQECAIVEWRGDSESEALSQTSSSAQSVLAFALNEGCMPMCGRAGGGLAAIVHDGEQRLIGRSANLHQVVGRNAIA